MHTQTNKHKSVLIKGSFCSKEEFFIFFELNQPNKEETVSDKQGKTWKEWGSKEFFYHSPEYCILYPTNPMKKTFKYTDLKKVESRENFLRILSAKNGQNS